MNKKNLTLIFRSVEQEHLGKDVFLVPYYLGKILNMDVHIVYSQTNANRILPHNVRGAKLIPIKNIFVKSNNEILRNIVNMIYILFHAPVIDILMQFYFSIPTAVMGVLYKKLNKKGVLYIKSDGKMGEWPLLGYYNSIHLKGHQRIRVAIKRHLYKAFLECVDIITVETNIGYNKFCTQRLLNIDLKDKVHLLVNGFDKEQFDLCGIEQKEYSEKENIIITVGRLGTFAKNTELILEAAAGLDFKNWKIVLIGPIEKTEKDFQKTIDDFYLANEELKDRVFFTGPIYDKKELWSWYNKAKIFVLTSRFEGCANVFAEASWFRNYVLSTDVGGSSEVMSYKYGKIIPQDDPIFLSNILQNIINNDNLKTLYDDVGWTDKDISWEKRIKDAVFPVLDHGPLMPD